uniref:RBR-type E3 ubiquitin transferase n=2 Tax=Chloropicon primus TaxID=1764295 RepID=A0A7S2SZF8_9CHLO|mmetsp:Transcript_12710/g.35519  ORF Transcript_12710/g.35519 Transcript_12710/m.35519 type:complete len:536 (+) Transcript_12710:1061-2668(+)
MASIISISDSSYEDEDFDSDGEQGMFSDVSSEEDTLMTVEDSEHISGSARKSRFACLDEATVMAKAETLVAKASSLLSLPSSSSKALLRYYKWDENRLSDVWFSDEAKVREAVGLKGESHSAGEESTSTSGGQASLCGICFENYPKEEMFAMECGHAFCRTCWRSYAENAIDEGAGSLQLRCINPDCKLLVMEDVMLSLLGEGRHREKYLQFSMRSFVDGSRMLQWCPAPGCTKVIECFDHPGSETPFDVQCNCGHGFCFTCGEESHRPADCTMRKNWIIKNSNESENLNWILSNSKPCPKCKRPIEKNYGCMHMTCAVCKYEFCWLCLGAWKDHGERTGGFYSCNKYEGKGSKDKDKKRRDFGRVSLERYMHYFERWNANKTSCAKACETHSRFLGLEDSLTAVSHNTGAPMSQLAFISEACNQVIECRKTLMWTYTYGYYNFDKNKAGNMKEFFEFLQGDAEYNLELLHNCVEVELQKYAEDGCGEVTREEFDAFRCKLTGLTKVTREYFEKLVYELENGLEGIKTRYASSAS